MQLNLKNLFYDFINGYDEKAKNAIWEENSRRFKAFWYKRIAVQDSPALTEAEMDENIRILDRNARGNTKDDEVVARAMIPQFKWHKLFKDIKGSKTHCDLINRIVSEKEDEEKARLLDVLRETNMGWKNHLTGASANGINTLMAALDIFGTLSIVSLNDRIALLNYLGHAGMAEFSQLSWGNRIVQSGKYILDQFNKAGIPGNTRTISAFVYSEGMKTLWKNRQDEISERALAEEDEITYHRQDSMIKNALNTILYGPPGTGKTYTTIERALQCLGDEAAGSDDRPLQRERFDRYVQQGRIVFTTFHQSMSYEDFIEGIKPVLDEPEKPIRYEVKPGVFKSICDNARTIRVSPANVDWEIADYYKMSLGGTESPQSHDWCIENNVIGLGWGSKVDITPFKGIKDWSEYKYEYTKKVAVKDLQSNYEIQATYWFLQMREGDIVVASRGNRIIDAIGIVKGGYYYAESSEVDFRHFRKVQWLATNINTAPERFLRKQISQMTLYRFNEKDIKIEAFRELTLSQNENQHQFVLIIDEINRGNVSQIFGELITLIEPDKRLGASEEIEVVLPYSKTRFGVPPNLYIIGTMNTADRSVEALDTALRRRFSFEEMPPRYDLPQLKREAYGVDIPLLLKTINARIEKLLDRDHLIGHSYFMDKDTDLKETFQNKIIPLLQEYFFGDYGKIGLVLGKGFVEMTKSNSSNNIFADFDYDEAQDLAERKVYRILWPSDMEDTQFEQALKQLMNGK